VVGLTPWRLSAEKNTPLRFMGPRAGLEALKKTKVSFPYSSYSTDWTIPAHSFSALIPFIPSKLKAKENAWLRIFVLHTTGKLP
jgi:hypothetical protein